MGQKSFRELSLRMIKQAYPGKNA